MSPTHELPVVPRVLAASGALLAGAAVALSAYAAHAATPSARSQLFVAAIMAFGHGVALVTLGRYSIARLAVASLAMLLAGVTLFSGSVVARNVLGWPSVLAPFGGGLMMLGWLLQAIHALRRSP